MRFLSVKCPLIGLVGVTVVVLMTVCSARAEQSSNLALGTGYSSLPVDVAKMTDADFAAWATEFNAAQRQRARDRYEADLAAGKFQVRTGLVSDASRTTTTRVGSGITWGGEGGAGGYLGYGTNVTGGFGGLGGYGLPGTYDAGVIVGPGGFAENGNAMRSTSSDHRLQYTMFWKDPTDDGGGPVTVINPYCREHWLE